VFNWVANWAYTRYRDMIQDIQKVQRELEGEFVARQPEIEAKALKLLRESPEQAREYLTAYSEKQAARTVARWRALGEELLVKYMDGNVKDSLGNVLHPPYPEEWYRRIVKEDGEHFRIKKLKDEVEPEQPLDVRGYFHSREELGELAEKVPPDFPFATDRLLLVPGTDRCGQKPQCCLSPVPTDGGRKLKLNVPESKPGKCGAPGWLVRLPKDERRPLVVPGESL
jgi:hypothetical protein